MDKGNVDAILRGVPDPWSPVDLADIGDCQVKVANAAGEFEWHAHRNSPEFFYILAGHLRIELRDRTVELDPGDHITIPAGVEHRPVADPGTRILLVERTGTLPTGDVSAEIPLDPRHR